MPGLVHDLVEGRPGKDRLHQHRTADLAVTALRYFYDFVDPANTVALINQGSQHGASQHCVVFYMNRLCFTLYRCEG